MAILCRASPAQISVETSTSCSPTVVTPPSHLATASSTNVHNPADGALRWANSSTGCRNNVANVAPRADPATSDLVGQMASL
eukprot:2826537-Pyramimonas_sp.AAC.1